MGRCMSNLFVEKKYCLDALVMFFSYCVLYCFPYFQASFSIVSLQYVSVGYWRSFVLNGSGP